MGMYTLIHYCMPPMMICLLHSSLVALLDMNVHGH